MRLDTFGVVFLLVVSCSNEPEAPANDGVPRKTTGVAHGDHNPHHGGVVLMHGDLHFEVILDFEGRHRVYLSDAVRTELPASAASRVSVTVLRPSGEAPEPLELEIDEFGESWIASGRPVGDPVTRALVALTYEGEPYEIELPFLAPPPDPDAPDPHATH
jgi:hypothetical protein